MNSTRSTYTKRMTADVWFHFQMRPDLEVIEIDSEYEQGEKLMVVTFSIEEQPTV
jgi:hypothetical protein